MPKIVSNINTLLEKNKLLQTDENGNVIASSVAPADVANASKIKVDGDGSKYLSDNGEYTEVISSNINNLVDGTAEGSVRSVNSMTESDSYKLGADAMAIGNETKASGDYSFASGMQSVASGAAAFAIGSGQAIGAMSYAEGGSKAYGTGSHAEGIFTTAGDEDAIGGQDNMVQHVEGEYSSALGYASHAEGIWTNTLGKASHAEGYFSATYGNYSHAEGRGSIATAEGQHVEGRNNIVDTEEKYAHIIGNGESDAEGMQSNAHTVAWDGTGWFQGNVKVGGTGQDDTAAKTLATTDYVDNIASVPAESLIHYEGTEVPDGYVQVEDIYTTHKYKTLVTAAIAGGSEVTVPAYYKVGTDCLDVYVNGSLMATSSDAAGTDGHYQEVGEANSYSNKIKITTDWSLAPNDILQFIIRGVYEIELYSFTVNVNGNVQTYNCEPGMTWEQWVASSYNTNTYTVNTDTDPDLIMVDEENFVANDDTSVAVDEEIVNGYTYTTGSGPLPV